jgi:hypothetical protein
MAIWPVAVLLPSAFGATKTTKLISADKKTETLKSEAESAMQQIINKNYALELQNAGAKKIIKIGIAFQGRLTPMRQFRRFNSGQFILVSDGF